MIAGFLIATGSGAPWERLAKVGDWAVVLFGLLFWVCCLFILFWEGMHVISTGGKKRVEHRRGRKAKQGL